MVKAGNLAYCYIAVIEDRGVGRDCTSDQEQEEEENITRKPSLAAAVKAVREHALRFQVVAYSMIPLLCLQTFSESCYTPKLCSSKTMENKAREKLYKFQ